MKKILFGACIALSVFFAGCSDFLDGSNLKSQIDKQISFANASIFKIDVNVINNDCGSVSEEGINEINNIRWEYAGQKVRNIYDKVLLNY